jgi:hypothetical protein
MKSNVLTSMSNAHRPLIMHVEYLRTHTIDSEVSHLTVMISTLIRRIRSTIFDCFIVNDDVDTSNVNQYLNDSLCTWTLLIWFYYLCSIWNLSESIDNVDLLRYKDNRLYRFDLLHKTWHDTFVVFDRYLHWSTVALSNTYLLSSYQERKEFDRSFVHLFARLVSTVGTIELLFIACSSQLLNKAINTANNS